MRIFHVTKFLPEFAGGIETATRNYAEAGLAAGAEVEIAGLAPRRVGVVNAESRGIRETPLRYYFHLGSLPIAPGYFFLQEPLSRCDVVHVHLPNPMAILGLMPLFAERRRPCVVPILHAPILRWRGLGSLWETTVQNWFLERSDKVIVSTRELLECLRERGTIAIPENKIEVIPYPIPEAVRPVSPNNRMSGDIHFLTVARLVPYKGLHVLVEAVARLGGGWHLTILGMGPMAAALRAQIAERGLLGRVTLVEGADDDTKRCLLEAADVFVMPSMTVAEAFGLAMAEAFSAGKPVITTDVPSGVRFLAGGGACGAVARAGSVDSLRDAMTRLMLDASLRAEAGRRNREFWEKNLTPERFVSRYGRFLEETVGARAKGIAA